MVLLLKLLQLTVIQTVLPGLQQVNVHGIQHICCHRASFLASVGLLCLLLRILPLIVHTDNYQNVQLTSVLDNIAGLDVVLLSQMEIKF